MFLDKNSLHETMNLRTSMDTQFKIAVTSAKTRAYLRTVATNIPVLMASLIDWPCSVSCFASSLKMRPTDKCVLPVASANVRAKSAFPAPGGPKATNNIPNEYITWLIIRFARCVSVNRLNNY